MDTTHTDFQDGERRDVTVSFVMQRIVECNNEEIQRLVVADDARTHHTLVVNGETTARIPEVDDWQEPGSRGTHERESGLLTVPAAYRAEFKQLRGYLAAEIDTIGDERLTQELDLLDQLLEHANRSREVSS